MHQGPETNDFPPGYRERFDRRNEAAGAANVSPLPGPLLEAWLPSSLTAAGFKLRPVVASDWAFLQRIDSPILRELAALQKPAEERDAIVYSDEEIWELVFLWTISPRAARAALAPGLHTWRETVMLNTADQLPAGVIRDKRAILDALAANLMRAMATSVAYESARGSEDPVVFTKPPAEPTMASAGG